MVNSRAIASLIENRPASEASDAGRRRHPFTPSELFASRGERYQLRPELSESCGFVKFAVSVDYEIDFVKMKPLSACRLANGLTCSR